MPEHARIFVRKHVESEHGVRIIPNKVAALLAILSQSRFLFRFIPADSQIARSRRGLRRFPFVEISHVLIFLLIHRARLAYWAGNSLERRQWMHVQPVKKRRFPSHHRKNAINRARMNGLLLTG